MLYTPSYISFRMQELLSHILKDNSTTSGQNSDEHVTHVSYMYCIIEVHELIVICYPFSSQFTAKRSGK